MSCHFKAQEDAWRYAKMFSLELSVGDRITPGVVLSRTRMGHNGLLRYCVGAPCTLLG